MSETFAEIASRLDAIAEELGDTAIEALKGAVRRGEEQRPAAERAVTQARRAVEKAAHLLRTIDSDQSDQFD
jgi:hypothetical protein